MFVSTVNPASAPGSVACDDAKLDPQPPADLVTPLAIVVRPAMSKLEAHQAKLRAKAEEELQISLNRLNADTEALLSGNIAHMRVSAPAAKMVRRLARVTAATHEFVDRLNDWQDYRDNHSPSEIAAYEADLIEEWSQDHQQEFKTFEEAMRHGLVIAKKAFDHQVGKQANRPVVQPASRPVIELVAPEKEREEKHGPVKRSCDIPPPGFVRHSETVTEYRARIGRDFEEFQEQYAYLSAMIHSIEDESSPEYAAATANLDKGTRLRAAVLRKRGHAPVWEYDAIARRPKGDRATPAAWEAYHQRQAAIESFRTPDPHQARSARRDNRHGDLAAWMAEHRRP
jgi:hypothetical protein